MARALLVAVMAIALVASSEACVGCIFKQLAGFDAGPKFDLASGGQSHTKVCGGQLKVEQACLANGKCGLYTFGGEKDCGYLKSKTAFPEGKVYKANLVPSKTWNVYYKEVQVPVPVPVPIPVEVIRTVNVPVPVPVPTPPQVVTRVVEKHVPMPVPTPPQVVTRVVEKQVPVPVPTPPQVVTRVVEKHVPVPVPVPGPTRYVSVPARVVERQVPVPVPVPGPTRYVQIEKQTLSTKFDIKTPTAPAYRVCGGLEAVADTCAETPGCEGYSMDANGKCGYLKSSGGRPSAYAQPGAFQPSAGVTYVQEEALPPQIIQTYHAQVVPAPGIGEVAGAVAGGVAGGVAQGVTQGVMNGVMGGLMGRKML